MRALVTGGLGFIGSNFANHIKEKVDDLVVVDKLNYAANKDNLNPDIKLYKEDIKNIDEIHKIIKKHNISVIINFAAETHVDNSIDNPFPFLAENVLGVISLLELKKHFKKILIYHISTDEVYGPAVDTEFSENDSLNPLNPYSASKASADCFILAYNNTFKTNCTIIRPCNNYGPRQHPEKLIPKVIINLLNGVKIPVYNKGKTVREWLYVDDFCDALWTIITKGRVGEIYNVSSGVEFNTLQVIKQINKFINSDLKNILDFSVNRPGIDFRYKLNSQKIRNLGWKPKTDFETGIMKTVAWFKNNRRS